jgi:hypothetical protein
VFAALAFAEAEFVSANVRTRLLPAVRDQLKGTKAQQKKVLGMSAKGWAWVAILVAAVLWTGALLYGWGYQIPGSPIIRFFVGGHG